MPQFSLKRLFASVTLIAMGCASFLWFFQLLPEAKHAAENDTRPAEYLLPFLLPSGFWLLGAGIGNLFKHAARGLIFGILAHFVIAFLSILIRGF